MQTVITSSGKLMRIDNRPFQVRETEKATKEINETFSQKAGSKEDKENFMRLFQNDQEYIFNHLFYFITNGSYGSEFIEYLRTYPTKDKLLTLFNYVMLREFNISFSQLKDCYKKMKVDFKALNQKIISEGKESLKDCYDIEIN